MQNPAHRDRRSLLGSTARICYRRRWLTLAVWIAGVAGLIALWQLFGAPADNNFTGTGPGQIILNQHFPRQSGDTLTLAVRSSAPVTSAAVRDRADRALAPLRQAPHVTAVTDPYTTAGHVARDGHIAFATVQFGVPSASIPGGEVTTLMNDARGVPGGRPPGPVPLHASVPPEEAAVRAMRTAGRSVLTAGTTVVIGMMGLLVLRQPLMTGVAVAAAATVAMTVLAALTLLPAMLGFTGTRLARAPRFGRLSWRRRPRSRSAEISAPRPHAAERWAAVISRHPAWAGLAAVAVIAVLALPTLRLTLNLPDESAQARGTMGRASYEAMAQGFGPGLDAPLIVAADLPPGRAGPPRPGTAPGSGTRWTPPRAWPG